MMNLWIEDARFLHSKCFGLNLLVVQISTSNQILKQPYKQTYSILKQENRFSLRMILIPFMFSFSIYYQMENNSDVVGTNDSDPRRSIPILAIVAAIVTFIVLISFIISWYRGKKTTTSNDRTPTESIISTTSNTNTIAFTSSELTALEIKMNYSELMKERKQHDLNK